MEKHNVKPHCKNMRKRSGNINDSSKLVAFIYTLIRDHVAPGDVEDILLHLPPDENIMYKYSNGWLAKYAKDIVKRLTT
jgi:hypothetical protein